MSERYAVVLDVFAVTTGADSLDCGVEPPDAGGPVDEAVCGDAPGVDVDKHGYDRHQHDDASDDRPHECSPSPHGLEARRQPGVRPQRLTERGDELAVDDVEEHARDGSLSVERLDQHHPRSHERQPRRPEVQPALGVRCVRSSRLAASRGSVPPSSPCVSVVRMSDVPLISGSSLGLCETRVRDYLRTRNRRMVASPDRVLLTGSSSTLASPGGEKRTPSPSTTGRT